jgi:Ca-activated chloride channel family protein
MDRGISFEGIAYGLDVLTVVGIAVFDQNASPISTCRASRGISQSRLRMVKTILILLVLTSAGPAQSSTDGPFSGHNSQDADYFFRHAQIRRAERLYPQTGALASNVASSAPVSLPTIRKEVQEVNLTFTVTDHRGHFVRNLAPSDFTINDNGEPPERITYFESQSELPLRLAIAIDSSDSVAYAFNAEKQSAIVFLRLILRRTADLALVMQFNQEVRLVQELTSDNDLLSHAIRNKLRSGGETAIYDAVFAASQQLAKVEDVQTARRAIILITDGEDNSSHINLEQAEEVTQRNECAVFVMSINLAGRNPEQSQRAMKELSEVSGGTFFDIRTNEGATIAFFKIGKELRSQYLISYKPARVSHDGSFHRIVVSGPKKLRIHHRDGYFAK